MLGDTADLLKHHKMKNFLASVIWSREDYLGPLIESIQKHNASSAGAQPLEHALLCHRFASGIELQTRSHQ